MAILVIFICYSFSVYSEEEVTYRYDKLKNEIYAKSGKDVGVLNFKENYTGNPTYSFGHFSGSPAIIVDGRALHDSTVYATLIYSNGKFNFDCFYYNIKSKKNGLSIKEGVCGLNETLSENYLVDLEIRTSFLGEGIDDIDTSLILKDRISYLPIVMHNGKEKLIYKIYDKISLLNDKYFIISLKNNGECKVYDEHSWVIYDNKSKENIKIMPEEIIDGRVELKEISPNSMGDEKCFLYSAFNVKAEKTFFYDTSFNARKAYLVKGDFFNLLSMSNDGKWCNIRYVSDKNKITTGNLLCSDLSLPLRKDN